MEEDTCGQRRASDFKRDVKKNSKHTKGKDLFMIEKYNLEKITTTKEGLLKDTDFPNQVIII